MQSESREGFYGRRGRRKRNLSKFLSLILRHRPQEFGLAPDDKGFVPFDALLNAVQGTSGWKWVRRSDVINIVERGEKKRFEIVGGRIRALYGHSIPTKLDMEEVEPPDLLYHATLERQAVEATEKGLSPRSRQFVLLSASADEAIRIGIRRVSNPALVTIRAREAREKGVIFYRGSDGSYLAKRIPKEFCRYDADDSAGEVHRHRHQHCLERALSSRRYVEQEDALEELFGVAAEDELQATFLRALEDEDPVKRANAATSLLPSREETVLHLLNLLQRERSVVVLRNIAIALDLIPVEDRFESHRPRVVDALRRLAACDDEYTRYRASLTLARLSAQAEAPAGEEFISRPDMTDEELAKTIPELPPVPEDTPPSPSA